MDSENLCDFCDNVLEDGATKCHICEAVITPNHRIVFPVPMIQSDVPKNVDLVPEENKVEIINEIKPKSEDSDWICQSCTFNNKSNLICCGVCFQDRVVVIDTVAKKSEVQEIIVGWRCTSCQSEISSESARCKKCEKENKHIEINNVEKNTEFRMENCATIWDCSKCSFKNVIIALKCSVCEQFNEKFTLCTKCNQYLVFKESVSLCTECLEDTKFIFKRSNSNPLTKQVSNECNDVTANPENRLFTSDFNMDASYTPGKPKKRSFVNRIRESFSNIDLKKRWKCKNANCPKENRHKLTQCKRCGTLKSVENNEIIDPNVTRKSHQSKLKKRVSQKPSILFYEDLLAWQCGDVNCKRQNDHVHEICQGCGRNKNMLSNVDHVNGNALECILNEKEV